MKQERYTSKTENLPTGEWMALAEKLKGKEKSKAKKTLRSTRPEYNNTPEGGSFLADIPISTVWVVRID
jgi:hypothetical protein